MPTPALFWPLRERQPADAMRPQRTLRKYSRRPRTSICADWRGLPSRSAIWRAIATIWRCLFVLPWKKRFPADADVLYEAAKLHMKAWNDVVFQMFQKTPASYRVNQVSAEIFEVQGRYAEAAAEYRKGDRKKIRPR